MKPQTEQVTQFTLYLDPFQIIKLDVLKKGNNTWVNFNKGNIFRVTISEIFTCHFTKTRREGFEQIAKSLEQMAAEIRKLK